MQLTTIFQIFKKPFNDALNAVGKVQPTVFPGAGFRCNSSTETLYTANSSVQDIPTRLPHDVPEAVKVQPPMSNVAREDADSQYCGPHETMGQINHSTPQSTSQPSRDPLIGASSVAQIQSPAVTQEAESHGRFVEETLEQIRKLTASNASIERSFTNVAGRLKRVVRQHSLHIDAVFRQDFEYLRDDWDSSYEIFCELRSKSREIAATISVVTQDFADCFLSTIRDKGLPVGPKLDAIRQYVENLRCNTKQAQELADGFHKLLQKVESFKTEVECTVKKHKGLLKDQINDIQNEIERIKLRIQVYQVEISTLNSILSVVTYTSLFCSIGRLKWTKRNTDPSTHSKLNTKITQQTALKIECDRKQHEEIMKLNALDAICKFHEESQNDIDTTAKTVLGFSRVWTAITSDLQHIEIFLKIADGCMITAKGKENTEEIPLYNLELFEKRVEKAYQEHLGLAAIFREYERAVGTT